jgi:hypothetical protein
MRIVGIAGGVGKNMSLLMPLQNYSKIERGRREQSPLPV